MVLKEVMAERRHVDDGVELSYARIPITAERPPDFTDLSELIEVMIRCNTSEVPIVINCQLGRGRSTLTAVSRMLTFPWPYLNLIVVHCLPGHPAADQTMAGSSDSTARPVHPRYSAEIHHFVVHHDHGHCSPPPHSAPFISNHQQCVFLCTTIQFMRLLTFRRPTSCDPQGAHGQASRR